MTGSETITAPFVLVLAAAWALWYVVGPLLRPRSSPLSPLGEGTPAEGWTGRGPPPGEAGAERSPERELQMVLAALRELERDRELGLVTAEEYAPLHDRHEARALALYREIDELAERRWEAVASAVAREKAALVAENGTAARAAARVPLRAGAPAGGWAGRGDGVPAPRHDAPAPGAHRTAPPHPAPPRGHPAPGTRPKDGWGGTRRPVPGRRTGYPSQGPGTRHPERGQARPSRRLAIGSAAVAVVFLAGVGALWYSGSVGRGAQRPIATVRAPDYHVLAFDPVAPGRVFLGTHAGLFVSGDRGQGWRPLPTADGDVMAVVPVPQEGTRLLAAGHDVFLGSPDGSSWQPAQVTLPGTDVHALAASPAVPSRLYAAVVGHGMFRSDDAGRTWTQTGQMPPSIAALAVVPDGGSDVLFAATAQEGVLASRDGGRGWGQASGFVNGALPTRQVTAIAYDGRSGDVGASQAGAFRGALFVATDRGVFRSTDGGSAWARLGLEADVAALAIAPDDPRTLLAVDTGGRVFRSADRGVTW